MWTDALAGSTSSGAGRARTSRAARSLARTDVRSTTCNVQRPTCYVLRATSDVRHAKCHVRGRRTWRSFRALWHLGTLAPLLAPLLFGALPIEALVGLNSIPTEVLSEPDLLD